MFDVSHVEVRDAVERALAEDIGPGDITSELTVPSELRARGSFMAKQRLVLAGIELLPMIYENANDTKLELFTESGSPVSPGDLIAKVSGNARTLLGRERVALNFLQRLSGIATLARKHVAAVTGTGVQVLDTRKTTPGFTQARKNGGSSGRGNESPVWIVRCRPDQE
jgi:nicotinate-nucleotide pyrophosphorylase (carboxylating)